LGASAADRRWRAEAGHGGQRHERRRFGGDGQTQQGEQVGEAGGEQHRPGAEPAQESADQRRGDRQPDPAAGAGHPGGGEAAGVLVAEQHDEQLP
jgi:hypothetical protein